MEAPIAALNTTNDLANDLATLHAEDALDAIKESARALSNVTCGLGESPLGMTMEDVRQVYLDALNLIYSRADEAGKELANLRKHQMTTPSSK